MSVIAPVILIPLIAGDRELIRPRLANRPQNVLGIEAAGDEILGQGVEQLGIRRRVAGANVVDRLDDADAEQISPQPVYVAFGEVLVVLRGNPVGQLVATSGR